MKKFFTLLLAFVLVLPLFIRTVSADVFSKEYTVEYTSENKIDMGDFSATELAQILGDIQPGDSAAVTFNIVNSSSDAVYFWMNNKTVQTLEENRSSARGAGYTYLLTYQGSDGKDYVFYNIRIFVNQIHSLVSLQLIIYYYR